MTDETPAAAAIAHSVPEWLAEMWWAELGPEPARSLMRAMNEPPETAMRVNVLRGDPAALRADLEAAGEPIGEPGGSGLLHPAEALTWEGPLGDAAIDALRGGWMFAQSRGAQAVIEVLGALPSEHVLDLCAGPGVKTVAIAARVGKGGDVVAVELDPRRARQVEGMARRGGASNVCVVAADATSTGERRKPFAGPDRGYDRVLVDPPCSDLGTLASRPDARWRKDPATIERLAGEQRQILETGIELLRPGGTLVYSTCTISRRENEDVVAAALAGHSDLREVRRLETRPDRDRTDGFFIAELARANDFD
jgi:16S rRNA (cytosine967-C5)-methyltransferase